MLHQPLRLAPCLVAAAIISALACDADTPLSPAPAEEMFSPAGKADGVYADAPVGNRACRDLQPLDICVEGEAPSEACTAVCQLEANVWACVEGSHHSELCGSLDAPETSTWRALKHESCSGPWLDERSAAPRVTNAPVPFDAEVFAYGRHCYPDGVCGPFRRDPEILRSTGLDSASAWIEITDGSDGRTPGHRWGLADVPGLTTIDGRPSWWPDYGQSAEWHRWSPQHQLFAEGAPHLLSGLEFRNGPTRVTSTCARFVNEHPHADPSDWVLDEDGTRLMYRLITLGSLGDRAAGQAKQAS